MTNDDFKKVVDNAASSLGEYHQDIYDLALKVVNLLHTESHGRHAGQAAAGAGIAAMFLLVTAKVDAETRGVFFDMLKEQLTHMDTAIELVREASPDTVKLLQQAGSDGKVH